MKYPKINYIGNKEKIADWIVNLMPVIHTFIEAVQNARRRSLTEKLNEFKEL